MYLLALFLDPNAIILGLVIFFIGITYYLLTIADRHSIVLTLAGLKFLTIIVIGIFIMILNNYSILSSPIPGFNDLFQNIFIRILISICIFTIGTVFFDIIPLKEIVYYFVRKVNKREVAIDIGIGQIILF